jgi:hypothetical protein
VHCTVEAYLRQGKPQAHSHEVTSGGVSVESALFSHILSRPQGPGKVAHRCESIMLKTVACSNLKSGPLAVNHISSMKSLATLLYASRSLAITAGRERASSCSSHLALTHRAETFVGRSWLGLRSWSSFGHAFHSPFAHPLYQKRS